MNKIRINDMCDLVETTIKDLVATGTEIFVSPIGKDKLQAIVDGKIYNFTSEEIMEQRHSVKGFIKLIQGRIK